MIGRHDRRVSTRSDCPGSAVSNPHLERLRECSSRAAERTRGTTRGTILRRKFGVATRVGQACSIILAAPACARSGATGITTPAIDPARRTSARQGEASSAARRRERTPHTTWHAERRRHVTHGTIGVARRAREEREIVFNLCGSRVPRKRAAARLESQFFWMPA
jgi:hypothetical protein